MSELQANVKEWVILDNKIKNLLNEVKTLRDKKLIVKDKIFNYAINNNILNSTIKISDGKLNFTKTKISSPISLRLIKHSLERNIDNNTIIDNIIDHIKSNRQFKINNDIKRFYD